MRLTLADAIEQLDILEDAVVAAGRDGLNRPIRWAHVVDLPDVTPWVREGDLLLTTAYALKDNPDALPAMVASLAEKGLSGIMVALGPYFHSIPQSLINLADKLNFPIITLPWEVPFVEVTQAIHEKILAQQFELLQQSMQVHARLTELVLQGKGMDELVETLAGLLNRSVTIEGPALNVIAYASPGAIDEIRRRSIQEGRTPPELIAYLEEQGLFERLLEDGKPQYVPPLPEFGMTLERTIAPILVGSQLLGYVWIIATDGPLKDLDFLAIERVATVAALILTREQAVFEAEQRLKANLLENLLELDPQDDFEELQLTSGRLGLHKGFQIFMLEKDNLEISSIPQMAASMERLICERGIPATMVQRGQRLVFLLGTTDRSLGEDIAANALEYAGCFEGGYVAGLSGVAMNAAEARRCYREASETVRMVKMLGDGSERVWRFDELGFLPWLNTLSIDDLNTNRYYQAIVEMGFEDEQEGSEWIKTLQAFLESGGNKQAAAQRLFVHRNTLRSRLSRISDSWVLDLDDSFVCMNLHIALNIWRLHHGGYAVGEIVHSAH